MEGGHLCGACDEANEEKPVSLKTGAGTRTPESIAKSNATRQANQAAKLARRELIRAARREAA
jgi:hypothetical protein